MAFLKDDVSLKEREEKWNNIIQERGSKLINILSAAPFELQVQEPFFSLLKDGMKTIEGRCAVGKYNRYNLYGFLC
uniref:Uncharacterized protein n=1 Tax=Rhizophora mucronata TaxID=61149 RepID=A0A2P2JGC7_RHIMU